MSTSQIKSPRLTVLQVLPALESGGVERGVLEVADALVAAGHRSLVVSKGGPMVEPLVAGGSEHFRRPIGRKSPGTLRWIPWLRRLIIEQQVDVVDYHSRLPGWIALAALRTIPKASRPVCISSLHGQHSVNGYSGVMCRGDAIVVVSETLKQYTLKNYPWVAPERIHVIYRGICEREFPRDFQLSQAWADEFEQRFGVRRDAPVISIVGRLTRLKGHHDFLRLVARLRGADQPVTGLVVGGAQKGKEAYQAELRAEAQRLGVEDAVIFTGPRRDLREIYRFSDVVLSLSRTPESFGRSVAEALAIGTPVVGYDHGGVAEILQAEFPVGAVPMGDEEQLFDTVRRTLAGEFRGRVADNVFRLERMLEQTVSLYEQQVFQLSQTQVRQGPRAA